MLLQYVVDRDADTLLPQFLGMYRITVNSSETHLIIMRCVFSPQFSIHCKYDLKASILHILYYVCMLCATYVMVWSGIVVSALASINEVHLCRVQLVLRWATVSAFNSRCRTFISARNQPVAQGQLSLPSPGVGKWVPASAGMVHSISGWTRGVQVKRWDPLRTLAIPERLRGVFTTRHYTNPRLPYFYLYVLIFAQLEGEFVFR